MAARIKAAAAPILKRRLAADMETSRDMIPTNGWRALQRRHCRKRECIVAARRVEITFFFRAMMSGKVMHGLYQRRIPHFARTIAGGCDLLSARTPTQGIDDGEKPIALWRRGVEQPVARRRFGEPAQFHQGAH